MTRHFIILILFVTSFGCSSLLAQERGMASYYSSRMHGRRMSNGERYHRDSLTCAHARYPLGTLLRVTAVKTGKSVIVKVTDRCARNARRIIDLSMAAAKALDLISSGVAMVMVEKWHNPHLVPYRDDEEPDLPELDYEITEKTDDYTPAWRKEKH